jgi:predicted nuclease of predicted toxin-antitoxin system
LKLLLDTCIARSARDTLLAAGHDVVWSGEWSTDPGDEQILTIAYQQQRVVVTLDKDFGELAVLRKLPHSGIIRLIEICTKDQGKVTKLLLEKYAQELVEAAIITVGKQKVRIRR